MSIRAMQAVWEHSQQTGGALVVMLAIADYAQDDGDGAYPSVGKLARKARMTDRNVNLLLVDLVAAGEITICRGAGPRGVNIYRINLPGLSTPEYRSSDNISDENITGEKVSDENISGEKSGKGGVKNPVRGGEKSGKEGVKPASPKPSLRTVIDPSEEPSAIPRVRAAPKPRDVGDNKRAPDPVWDSLVAGIGYNPQTTQERKRFGKAVAELKLCGAAPDDIRHRCDHYRRRWPTMELTPEALIKHWSTLEQAPGQDIPLWKRVKVWD